VLLEKAEDVHELRIGNRKVKLNEAVEWVRAYTSEPTDPNKPYGYPWYDTYDTGNSLLLVDGDLLAPVLLNVRPTIAAYSSLKVMTGRLNSILETIPASASLLEIEDLAIIGALFAPLDTDAAHGVGGTTLAKVLHRKRPHLIPLYDRRIWNCYCTADPVSGSDRVIPAAKTRSWAEFMMLMAGAIQKDLTDRLPVWRGLLGANPPEPPISLLRCFDIVAWRCGASSELSEETQGETPG